MTMVLMAVGIPTNMIEVILPVDWFLDRFRTMINVYGDAVGAAIVSKVCEKRLNEEPCDDAVLPPVEQVVAEHAGGLKDVNLKELDNLSNTVVNTLRRKSAADALSVSMVSDDAGVESGAPPSGISGMLTPKSITSGIVTQQAKVFVVDEETIILRF